VVGSLPHQWYGCGEVLGTCPGRCRVVASCRIEVHVSQQVGFQGLSYVYEEIEDCRRFVYLAMLAYVGQLW